MGNGSLSPQLYSDPRPIIGVVIFLFVGLLTVDTLWWRSCQLRCTCDPSRRRRDRDADTACPALHDKSGAGHPLAGVLVLDVGRSGALLAMPMLAIIKIICDRIRPFMAFGRFIEG